MTLQQELRDTDRDILEEEQDYRYVKVFIGIALITAIFVACYYLDKYFVSSNNIVAKTTAVQKISTTQTSGVKFAKIQDIEVGERAIGINPEITDSERSVFLPDPEPATWRKLTLEMIKSNGKRLDITLLRSLVWIEESNAAIGATIYLDLPEMGAQGSAKVLNIEPCPPIKRGKGNVITGTFHHEAANTIDLHVEGLDKPIGCTDNHPFWSVTRNEFIEAGKLQQGEELQLHNGQTAKIVQILLRSKPERVHNLEVMNEHVYQVTNGGILVHNIYRESRGSTGRTVPRSKSESDAMTRVMLEQEGRELHVDMNDPRWPKYEGWRKMEQKINTDAGVITIHYLKNIFDGNVDDFKFKD